MRDLRARNIAASFLLVFCAGTLLSPHRHLNPIADLITDGRSDSGVIVRASVRAAPGTKGSIWSTVSTEDDEACLACFWHDMTASATCVFRPAVATVMLAITLVRRPVVPCLAVFSPPLSRGPPA